MLDAAADTDDVGDTVGGDGSDDTYADLGPERSPIR